MKFPSFSGDLRTEPAALANYARDFGGIDHRVPAAVLRPRDVEDVVRAVRFARAERLTLAARGHGHSTRGQSLTAGGVVVDMSSLDRVLGGSSDSIQVEAGIRWNVLLRETLRSSSTPPVLTDYIDLSVGGTIAMGGIGGQTFRHGFQIDNVLELGVVTGEGELVRCSASQHAQLFHACLGGLGQFGLVVDATLRLVPAPPRVRVFHLRYDDLALFLRDQQRIVDEDRFDYVRGDLLPEASGSGLDRWVYHIECVQDWIDDGYDARLRGLGFTGEPVIEEVDYIIFANRLDAMVTAMKSAGTWEAAHPWFDVFLPASRAAEHIGAALRDLAADELGNGYVMTYPVLPRNRRRAAPGLPSEDHAFLFGILPNMSRHDAESIRRFEARCIAMYSAARRIGGTVYPHSFPIGTRHITRADWEVQMGRPWSELARDKQAFDPDHVLAPGVGMFSKVAGEP